MPVQQLSFVATMAATKDRLTLDKLAGEVLENPQIVTGFPFSVTDMIIDEAVQPFD